jgi:tryptophanyl-tRNA synthetase
VDPNRATLFIQSRLPEHAELFTLLAMHTPVSWLERTPSYKDALNRQGERESASFGFLGYPLLQAADILLYGASLVPVGEDQAAHVEITREVARRFNHRSGRAVLSEPVTLLTDTPRLPGLDGEKMSKSSGNTLAMRDAPEVTADKLRRMPTDPQRIRRGDAGEPKRCPVWPLHEVYTSEADREELASGCRSAGIGCLDCKQGLIESITAQQQSWRERAEAWTSQPKQVQWLMELGTEKARTVAKQTLREVRDAMGLRY